MPNINVFNVNKKVDNNLNIFYSANNTIPRTAVESNPNLVSKIYKMFNSPSYIYKIDAEILMKSGKTIKKAITGFYNNELVTIDDEVFSIDDIADIAY